MDWETKKEEKAQTKEPYIGLYHKDERKVDVTTCIDEGVKKIAIYYHCNSREVPADKLEEAKKLLRIAIKKFNLKNARYEK